MKRILRFFLPAVLCLVYLAVPVYAAEDYGQYDFTYRNVVDDADLIENDRELSKRLDAITKRYNMDVVIVTVESMNGKEVTPFADDFYDYNNYKDDGILFLISTEYRDWAISTKGDAIDVFTDARQSAIVSAMRSYLSRDDFQSAFNVFAEKCDSILSSELGMGKIIKVAVVGVVVGIIAAIIVVLILKSQLKSVKLQHNANNYMNRNSIRITQSHDTFLYKTLSKTRRESSSGGGGGGGGGGGSSTHTSSSGSTHGGSSGKF